MTLGYFSLITVRQSTTENLYQEVYDTGASFSHYSQSTTQNLHQKVYDTGVSFSYYSQTIYDSKSASGSL